MKKRGGRKIKKYGLIVSMDELAIVQGAGSDFDTVWLGAFRGQFNF
jgi:hypothetical protein